MVYPPMGSTAIEREMNALHAFCGVWHGSSLYLFTPAVRKMFVGAHVKVRYMLYSYSYTISDSYPCASVNDVCLSVCGN